jgi:hypothetical protein
MGLRSSSLYSELRLKPIPHHRPPKRFLCAEKLNPTQRPNSEGAKYQERSTGRGGAGVRTRDVLSKAKMSKSEYQRRLFQYGPERNPTKTKQRAPSTKAVIQD